MSERSVLVRVLRSSFDRFASWRSISQGPTRPRIDAPWLRQTMMAPFFAILLLVPLLSLAPVHAQDTDNDTVLDAADLDDDNDGVLDLLEGHSTGNSIDLTATPTLLSGTGTIADAVVGDFILYDDAIDDGVTTFDVVAEVVAIQRDLATEILDFSTTRFFEIGSLTGEKFDSNQDEHVMIRLHIVADGSATVGNPTGTPATVTNATFTFGDIDSDAGRNFTEVFGFSTATPPDTVTLPGAPSLLENAGFVNGGGPGAGYTLYRMRQDVAGNPANWTDELNLGATANVSVELFFSSLSQLEIVFGVTGFNVGNTRRGAVVSTDVTIDLDTDNDGVANRLDRDSDNDGISDLIESGQDASTVDIANDGAHDGGVNGSGVPTAANGGAGVTPATSDADSIADLLDLDSDNDGIPDNVEAQATTTYVAPAGPVDANGVNASGLFSPIDTNSNGSDDYTDTDSDGDLTLDSVESGLTPGADTDGDGIGDGINASYADVNGDINDPATDLLNAGGFGEVDFRNAQPTAVDDSAATSSGGTVVFSVTANDTDSNGTIDATTVDLDPATAGQQTTLPVAGEGAFSVDASGNVTFTADPSFSGTSAITYTVMDNDGATSNTANITVTVLGIDYGDAPDTGAGTGTGNYRTTAADGGPSHVLTGPFLGGCVDADDGTLQDVNSLADDSTVGLTTSGVCLAPGSDERGVVTTVPGGAFIPGQTVTGFALLMSGSPVDCQLDAWLDFNQNGDFNDPGERIASGVTLLAAIPFSSLSVTVPADAVPGMTYARFRCTSAGIATPDGPAPDGEVEDYPITIAAQSDMSITQTDSVDPVNPGASLAYTITVSNAGPSDARNVVVTNSLPAGVTFVSTSGCAEDPNGNGTCSLGTITVGSSAQYTLTVTVDNGTTGTLSHTATVSTSATDNNSANDSSTELTTINAVPVAANDSALTQINTPVTLDVTANDSDSDGTIDVATVDLDPVTAGQQAAVAIPGEGSFSKDVSGIVTFTPEPSFTGASVITYVVNDNHGATSNVANIAVTVNSPPTAVGDSALTQLNTPVVVDVTINDSDSDGNIDTATVDLDPATAGQQATFTVAGEGTFTDDGAGNVTFTPEPTFTGASSITYTVNDNDGGTSNAASITITTNAPPVANADTALTQINTPVVVTVTANDTDSDGIIDHTTVDLDPATAGEQSTITVAGQGTFTDDSAGNVTFTPEPGFTGASSVTYTVEDNDGGTSNAASITITINAPPTAVADTAETPLNTAVVLNVTGNDSDSDGTIDPATVDLDPTTAGQQTTFAVAGEGTFTVDGAGNVTFTPEPAFFGPSVIAYIVNDNDGGTSNTATITITVNTPPTAVADASETALNAPVTVAVTSNDTDSDGTIDAATVDLDPVTAGQQTTFVVAGEGTYSVDGAGLVTFTPVTGFIGVSTIAYTVNDDDGDTSNNAAITITVLDDTDRDGVPDITDIDDDNDGITDSEDGCVELITNGSFTDITGTDWANWTETGVLDNLRGGVAFDRENDVSSIEQTGIVNWDPSTASLTIDVAWNDSLLDATPPEPAVLSVFVDGILYLTLTTPAGSGSGISAPVSFFNGASGNVSAVPETESNFWVALTLRIDLPGGASTGSVRVTFDSAALNTGGPSDDLFIDNVSVTDCSSPDDTDSEGIANLQDLDSDNDGIPDIVEAGGTDADGDAINDRLADTDGDRIPNSVDADVQIAEPDTDGDGIIDIADADEDGNGSIDNGRDTDRDGINDDNDPDANGNGLADSLESTTAAPGLAAPDFDTDTIPNHLDVDSDNDGIPDTVEAGATDADGDGEVPYPTPGDSTSMTDTDGDGLSDDFDDLANGPVLHDGSDIGDPLILTDGGGTPIAGPASAFLDIDPDFDIAGANWVDLDADDDTIPDNIEWQTTSGYVAPAAAPDAADANGNGWAYDGTSVTPINTDGNALPDYLDTDSDDDTLLDEDESGLANSGTDIDSDGIVDSVNASRTDVNGDVNDPVTDLANAGGFGQVDFRNVIPAAAADDIDPTTTFPYITHTGIPITLSATDNDSDSDGTVDVSTVDLDPLTAGQQTTFTLAGIATLTVDALGNVTVSPAPGFFGDVVTPYTVNDNDGATSNLANITVHVNNPPVAVDDTALTQVNTPVTLPAIIFNDTDADGAPDPATVDLDPSTAGIQTTFTVAGEGTFVADPFNSDVTFTPVPGYFGTTTISYVVDDNDGATSNAANIIVRVNEPPVAVNDTTLTQLNTATVLAVTANDTDGDGTVDSTTVDLDPATAGVQTTFAVAGQGVFTDDGAGNVTFTPEPGFTGLVAMTYTVNDNDGAISNAGTISVTVNAPPTAVDDTALTQINTPVTLNVTANDTDSDGTIDAATVDLDTATAGQQTTVVIAGQGTFAVDGLGNVTFTPDVGFTGPATRAYTVNDNDGGTSNAANITVTVNDPPAANNDSALTQLNTPVSLNVTTNDTDSDGAIDPATVDLDTVTAGQQTTVTIVGQGVFSVDGAGVVTFTPTAGFTGASTLTYTVNDNDGGLSNAANITITVNEPPEADNDTAVTPRDQPITTNVTTNDSDDDGTIDAATVDLDPITAGRQTTFTVAGEGTYTVDNAGNVTFTPVLGFVGNSSAAYVVNDNDGGLSNTATLTITVQDGPAANDDTALTLINTPVTINVTANDVQTDNPLDVATVDLDPATAGRQTTLVVAGEGTFTVDNAGIVTFTPEPGFAGDSEIMYTVSDTVGTASNEAEIEVEVNIPPTAGDDSGETPFNTPITVDVTANDADADGSIVTGSVDLDPATAGQQTTFAVAGQGTFSVDGAGLVTFTPEPTFSGLATITYTINDDDGASSNAASIGINVNTPPVAEDDSATTPLNTPVAVPVLINDSDADGDPIQITAVSPPANGATAFTPTGQIIFTPNPGFTGTDIFTYTIDDGRGDSATAFVSVTVENPTAANLPPTAVADQSRTAMDTPVTIDVLTNDYDPDNDPLTLSAVTAATTQGGTAAINDGGTPGDPSDDTVVYTPALGFTGLDSLTYTIDDGQGGTDTAIVSIEVTAPAADPIPTANGDAATTPHDVAVTIDVLANDTHPTPDPLTITAAVQGANGTVSVSDNGTPGNPGDDTLLYTPNPGFVGHDTLTYTIVDANGDEAMAAVSVTVSNVPPIAADDSTLTQIDTPVSLSVTANDTDSDGTVDAATVDLDPSTAGQQTTFTMAGQGTMTVDGSGTATFTPEAGFTGTVAVAYTVDDETGGTSAPGTITIRVNDPPVAVDDNMVTPVGTVVTHDLVGNDRDSDGTVAAATVDLDPGTAGQQTTFAVAGQGTFSVDAAGTVTFTPEPGFVGFVNAAYTINDNDGRLSNTAAIVVEVRPGPVANNDNALTILNIPVTLDVTANDVAADNPLNLASVDLNPSTAGQQTTFTVAGEGVYSVDGAGNVTFTPEIGFAGTATTTYTISDTIGIPSNSATISILVNIPPVAVADRALTQVDTPITVEVTANDTDADGTVDTATVDLDPSTAGRQTTFAVAGEGSFSVDNAGHVTFTPEAGFTGLSVLAYTVDDNDGGTSNAANLSITVNAPPAAADDTAFTQFNTAVTLTVTDNDSDTDGTIDTATVDLDTATAGQQTSFTVADEGTFSVDGSGAVTFTPDNGFFGISTLAYTVNDNDGGTSNSANISVEVNAPPVAEDDSGNTAVDTAISIPVLVNDYDPDEDPIQVTAVTPPANGTVTFTPEGELIYTPAVGFTGTDTLTYTIEDSRGGSDTATITIMVVDSAAVNLPPTAVADQSTTERDTPISIAVLTNDYDPEGDPLTLGVATPTITLRLAVPNTTGGGTTAVDDGGTAGDTSDDTIIYTPAPGFTGVDTFIYTIDDGQGNRDTALVTVRVTEPASPRPTANGDSAITRHDSAVTIDVLSNDASVDILNLTSLTNGANGSASRDDNGTPGDLTDDQVIYTPNALFVGNDTFTYTITNANGNTATAAITVTVTNEPPLANDDSAHTPANTPGEIPVLVNDHDRDGDVLTLITTLMTLPANGTVTLFDDGHVTYFPNAGFSGTDAFIYQVCDPIGACDTAEARIVVSPPDTDNAPPTAVADNSMTPLNTPVAITVLSNDFEPDGEPLTITPMTDAPTVEGGTFSVDGDKRLVYIPPFGFAGTDTLEYEVCDAAGNCDTALVFVEVQPAGADPGPQPVGDSTLTPEGVPVMVDVFANDTHPTGDILTITDITDGAHGTATLDDGGTPGDPTDDMIVYTPEAGFVGHDVFTYTVTDSNGDATRAAVSVNVVNGQPTAMDDTVTTGVSTPVAIDVLANDTDPNGNTLTVISVSQPVGGTLSINPDSTVTFTPDEGRRAPATFAYTISDGSGGTSTATVTVNFVENFAAPTGDKMINPLAFPELEWRIVWINSSNDLTSTIRVTDTIPAGTTFVDGSLMCDAQGISSVARCDYDSGANQLIFDGTIGPDLNVANESDAVNAVIITFRVTVPPDFFGTAVNQAKAHWDADGDGNVDDEIAAGQVPVVTDDPVTLTPNDATAGNFAPGACLFQIRPASIEADEPADPDLEAAGDPVEGGFEGTEARQASAPSLTLTTPTSGQVVAGSAVAVAALQGPSIGTTISESVAITVANNDPLALPDIIEADGVKTEVLPALDSHTVVTTSGLLAMVPANSLDAEDTLEVRTLNTAELPLPLPGEGAAGFYQLSLSGGRTQLNQSMTLRLPYSDIDQNSQIDGTTLSETTLTLWRYEPARSTWVIVPNATVIPETDVVVVNTDQLGILGVFRSATGELASLGSAIDDAVTLGTALNAATDSDDNEGWSTIGRARMAPHVVAWDTTTVADGAYDLRTVCSLDTTLLSVFEATPADATTTNNGGNSNCFIATAAYGSSWQPQVRTLRNFRDTYLLTHRPGRWLVDQYYRLSPPLADLIRDRDSLRAAVRVALTPIVWTAQLTQTTLGWTVLATSFLAMLSTLGLVYRCRSHRPSVQILVGGSPDPPVL